MSRDHLRKLITLILMIIGGPLMIASFIVHGAAPAQKLSPAPPPSPIDQSLLELETRLQRFTKQEVATKFTESGNDIVEKAKRSQEAVDKLLGVIGWVTTLWFGLSGFIITAFAFIGWKEYRNIVAQRTEASGAATEAATAATHVKSLESEVTTITDRLRALTQTTEQTMSKLAERFNARLSQFGSTLPILHLYPVGIVGEAPDLPPTEEIAIFEEADMVISLAEMTQAITKDNLVEPFIKVGYYYLLIEDYPKAIARFKKAIELKSDAADAYQGLAKSLYSFAIRPGVAPRTRISLLEESEKFCKQYIDIKGKNSGILFDLGWISDEREDFEHAVKYYREARQLDVNGTLTDITYNLACSLSKWRKFQEALDELRTVIGKSHNWQDAPRDPDLKLLIEDPVFGPLFLQLIEEERVKH